MRHGAGGAARLRWVLRLLLLAAALGVAHPRKSKRKTKSARRAAALTPEHKLGAQLFAERRLPEALESFDRAVALGGAVPKETRELRSRTLGTMGRLPEALAEIELALEQDPDDDPAWHSHQWFVRGILLQQLGKDRIVESAESMRTAHRLSPDQGRSQPELLVSLCVSHAGLHAVTDQALKMQYLEDGVEFCDAAVAASAGSADARTQNGLKAAHLNKGMILMHLNRVPEAWAATDAATSMVADLKPVPAAIEASAASSPFPPPPSQGKMHKLWPVAAEQSVYSPAELPFHLVPDDDAAEGASFSTPVWISHAAGANVDSMNAELRRVVHEVRKADPRGNHVSNVGGWQSAKTRGADFASFLQEQAESSGAARALYAHIVEQLSQFLEQLQIPAQHGEPHVTLKESWVNVNDRGHYNRAHSHLTNTFSGCYYIASGWDDDETSADATTTTRTGLQFVEPWERANSRRRTNAGGGGGGGEEEDSVWTESSLGLPGTLAMWPGPVNHSVAVHEGGRERISLAFNLALVLK